jgi:cobalt/nickel transport system ATP-binding protein
MQPDMLKSIRLDVPVLPRLLKTLRENGVEVSMAYTYNEAEDSLLKAFGKRS